MSTVIIVVSILLLVYLIGALPFSLIVTRLKGVRIEEVGSGNLGATNVYRALGLKYAIFVFLCDFFKGFIPVIIAIKFIDNLWLHIGIAFLLILAHSFSIFARFKGGKGVATGAGVLAAIHLLIFGIVFPVAVLLIVLFRRVAIVSIGSCLVIPILFYLFKAPHEYMLSFTLLCGLIICLHYKNIIRIIKGEESKI